MLKKLKIQDFTLIKLLEVNFKNGFQVLTGETGAGKSVIVGAVALLCGQRGQGDVVRSGANKAVLEMEYEIEDSDDINAFLETNNIDTLGDTLILRREINVKGISRAFINDTPTSLNLISNLTASLIDLHGQHQHQKLLYVENHEKYLDDFASLNKTVEKYKLLFRSFNKKRSELEKLYELKRDSVDQHDLYSYQVSELEKANLEDNELEKLQSEKLKLENSEQLFDVAQFVGNQLYSSENSALATISLSMNKLKNVEKFDDEYKELSGNLNSARVMIEEVGRTAELLKEKIEFNPERLEEIRNREAEIDWLIKKYKVKDVTELINHLEELKSELNHIVNFDKEIEQLQQIIKTDQTDLVQKAIEISKIRKTTATALEKQMIETLKSLGMNNAQFSVSISWVKDEQGIINLEGKNYKLTETGADRIEFLVSMNKGEPLKPLQKVASGGEISRIMLALKSILNDVDDTNTMIFDEIDSGISGKVAQIVGNKFQEIGKRKQLIVITHLPQIAAQAINQFAVEKSEIDNRTSINIKDLNADERVMEIAKLLGGESISPEAIANAQNLLKISVHN